MGHSVIEHIRMCIIIHQNRQQSNFLSLDFTPQKYCQVWKHKHNLTFELKTTVIAQTLHSLVITQNGDFVHHKGAVMTALVKNLARMKIKKQTKQTALPSVWNIGFYGRRAYSLEESHGSQEEWKWMQIRYFLWLCKADYLEALWVGRKNSISI